MEVEPKAFEEKLSDQGSKDEDTEVIKSTLMRLKFAKTQKTYEVFSLLLVVLIILFSGLRNC